MPQSVRFEVKRTKVSYVRMILDLVSGSGPDAAWYLSKYPEVAIFNGRGDRRVLEVWNSDEEAEHFCSQAQLDYREMPIEDWCEKYGVPPEFIG